MVVLELVLGTAVLVAKPVLLSAGIELPNVKEVCVILLNMKLLVVFVVASKLGVVVVLKEKTESVLKKGGCVLAEVTKEVGDFSLPEIG